ncbi:thiamine pyrophosphate-dependent enzyme [Dictyobacter formicarum]|uniref:Transketolase n=1 Tax=Dictyobacter formicarum TaxID=2778368 RepID=A0ABQ3VGM9_9CHLR|nr:thiamine pyrophosphate-dependent enzyme [Dictyobacter formicarum]GHO85180.1 transketolase [Dictyobacter formicarum]
MTTDLTAIKKLMTLATGDEKHNASAHSTLDVLWVLYDRILRYDPQQPHSEERDRFILSKGHGPVALYAILAAKGFFPSTELSRFKSWDGILGAHPDRHQVPGIEVSTGSLGHGLPMAIGVTLALQAKHSDRRVFTLVGDAECNEGSIWEAVMVAGQKRLNQLTCIVINNHSSSIEYGDMAARFEIFGWHASTINGRDHEQIYAALSQQDTSQPSVIIAEIAERKGA